MGGGFHLGGSTESHTLAVRGWGWWGGRSVWYDPGSAAVTCDMSTCCFRSFTCCWSAGLLHRGRDSRTRPEPQKSPPPPAPEPPDPWGNQAEHANSTEKAPRSHRWLLFDCREFWALKARLRRVARARARARLLEIACRLPSALPADTEFFKDAGMKRGGTKRRRKRKPFEG